MTWQALDEKQDARQSNQATGTTGYTKDQVQSLAVFIIQTDDNGRITNLACGLGPGKFKKAGADGTTPWSLQVRKIEGVRALKRGRGKGISLMRRTNGTVEPWVTDVEIG
jgi:hypothetical protein